MARVQAVRVLSYQITPATFAPYEEFVQPHGTIFIQASGGHVEGEPLTDAFVGEVSRVLHDVAEDPATPQPVRIAAQNVAGQADAAGP